MYTHFSRLACTSTLLLWVLGCISSCSSNNTVVPTTDSPLIAFDSVGYYSKGRIQAVVDSALDVFMTGRNLPPSEFRSRLVSARHGVRLYKVTYTSLIPEMNNRVATAYGLIAIPDSILPGAPIVSYQHGAVFDRSWVPSNPDGSIEIQFQLSQFASQGYIVIAADYFGTTAGTTVPNSFGAFANAAQACLDHLRASKQVLVKKNIVPGKLFLSGWSQGGAVTNAFLQRLEREQIPVAAAVTASGPVDLVGFISRPVNDPPPFLAPSFPVAIMNTLITFEMYYGLNGLVAESIQSPFVEAARKFHEFEIPFSTFYEAVLFDKQQQRIRTMKELFTQKFLDDSKTATTAFWKKLDDLNGYRQLLRTPYRSFYSYRDEGVLAETVTPMISYQKSMGNTTIEGFDAGPNADHASVYLESIISAKPWFDSIR
jgi:hypothetical protein